MSRLDAKKALGRHDTESLKQVDGQFAGMAQVLSLLNASIGEGELAATVKSETTLLDRYQTAFRRAASLDAEKVSLMNGAMRQAGETLSADAVKAKDSNLADQAMTEKEASDVTSSGETVVMVLGLAGLDWASGLPG